MSFNDQVEVPQSEWGVYFPVLTAQGAEFVMLNDTTYAGSDMTDQILGYGKSLSAYGVTCSTSTEGIFCTAGQHSMTLSASKAQFN